MSTGKLLQSILVGAAAGALAAILFAPDKGSQTRKKIAQKSNELGEDLKSKFNDMTDSLKEKYESINKQATEILKKEKASRAGIKNDFV